MIKTIIRLRDNTVVVFDAEGEQVPEYQGKYLDVREIILRDVPDDAVFNHWFGYSFEPGIVSRENW